MSLNQPAIDPIPVKSLAPCPFCGSAKVEAFSSSWEFYHVECATCCASGPNADFSECDVDGEHMPAASEALACERWNRRVPAPEPHDHPTGLVHRDYHAAVVAQMQADQAGVVARPGDDRWRECKHHHHGCACREHDWEVQVATLTAERAVLRAEVERLQARLRVTAQTLIAEVGADRPLNADDVAMRAVVRIRNLEAEVERLQNGLAQVMRATNPGIDYDPAYAILDVQSALSRLEWLHDYIRGRRGVTNPEQAAQDERAAAVAWLTAMAARYVGVRDVEPRHVVSALAKNMAGGLHWITEGGTP